MPVDHTAPLRITGFDGVPGFARGYVRDLRPRWACEEIGLPYSTGLISAADRPAWYFAQQPWGQVPVLEDGDARPGLAAYLRRGTSRPAFAAALHAQLSDLQPEPALA